MQLELSRNFMPLVASYCNFFSQFCNVTRISTLRRGALLEHAGPKRVHLLSHRQVDVSDDDDRISFLCFLLLISVQSIRLPRKTCIGNNNRLCVDGDVKHY